MSLDLKPAPNSVNPLEQNQNLKNLPPFAIFTDSLSKSYGSVQALKGLNLRVPKNSIFGFLGPNGAGKTTTIKLLLGLIKATSGRGVVLGQDMENRSVEVRRRIGYLAQIPMYYNYMTARQTLLFKLRFYCTGKKKDMERRVEKTLNVMGLEDKADRPIKGFSGGERQRLGIAQAEVHEPDLLILDEPTANLDPIGRHEVLEAMTRLRKESTILYSTHILEDVQRVSDHIAILNKGVLLAQARTEDLLRGSGASVYNLTLKGPYQGVFDRIRGLPWVANVNIETSDSRIVLGVSVTDEEKAEDDLVRQAVYGGGTVTEFSKKHFQLEDVFMDLVEGVKVAGK
jgi:ABC-2 type transport system ATP-binding protein